MPCKRGAIPLMSSEAIRAYTTAVNMVDLASPQTSVSSHKVHIFPSFWF